MAEYRCICCGEIKESEKECNCSKCGYRMYLAPYDRGQILIQIIREFIYKLRVGKDIDSFFRFYRDATPQEQSNNTQSKKTRVISKSEDEARFPNFNKIQGYVCSAEKTEKFIGRLEESIEQMRTHFHDSFQASYALNLDLLKTKTNEFEAILKEALKALYITVEFAPLDFPSITLDYNEIPDEKILSLVDTAFELLEKLVVKIHRFIKANNIYGTAYQYKFKSNPKRLKDQASALKETIEKISDILDKRYTVDIFSDGVVELHEMLAALWDAICIIMGISILKPICSYKTLGGTVISKEAICSEFFGIIQQRYAALDSIVYSEEFLTKKNEDELFDLYNQMIKVDSLGLLGINKMELSVSGESERKLNALIGLRSIKDSIRKIKAYAIANKGTEMLNLHMCFYGNPGTGKTEVARIIAGILYENKILPTNHVIEVDRGGLVGQYLGETAQKTMAQIERAMGGVLFIDEAYALIPPDGRFDYGNEAVATLIKAMEDYRGKFCVIMAGYRNQMHELISSNPGIKSRIQFELDFPNYDRKELEKIATLMLNRMGYSISEEAMCKILDVTDFRRMASNFANARELRNILEQVIMCQNLRCGGGDDREIGLVDVNNYIKDSRVVLPTSDKGGNGRILTAEEELDRLVGLDSVKRMVKKIKAYAKRNQHDTNFNLHMCFYGNPGTGKTEVARIISRILYEAGVLTEAKFIETDAHGLMGKFVGETAPKTEAKVREAMGGVLFIDEAYELASNEMGNGTINYGAEAMSALIKQMEDYRGRFCVILVGYQEEMKSMIGINPGLKSRIQFELEFPDYTKEELGEIAKLFLKKKGYRMAAAAEEKLLDVTEYYRKKENFANARTVRNVIDKVILNQNLRTDEEPNNQILLLDVEEYISEEKIDLNDTNGGKFKIGFGQ